MAVPPLSFSTKMPRPAARPVVRAAVVLLEPLAFFDVQRRESRFPLSSGLFGSLSPSFLHLSLGNVHVPRVQNHGHAGPSSRNCKRCAPSFPANSYSFLNCGRHFPFGDFNPSGRPHGSHLAKFLRGGHDPLDAIFSPFFSIRIRELIARVPAVADTFQVS